MTRLGIRRRLIVVVLAAVATALAVMILGFNFVLGRILSADVNDLLRARASAELSRLDTSGDRLQVAEAADDATSDSAIWVFAGGRVLEAPKTTRAVSATARELTEGGSAFREVPSADVRLYAAPVVRRNRTLGTVVTAVSLAPYEATRRTALLGSLALGAALLLLVFLSARWLLASSLRPVARMTKQAEAWSEKELDRRFGLGHPHDELTELAATLDGLLDRLAASLRREQSFSEELSHELRTPLSRLIAGVEFALQRERSGDDYRAALESVHRDAEQLTRTVDTLLAASRQKAGIAHGTADAFVAATQAASACAGLAAERGLEVDVAPPARPTRVGVQPGLAERVLQPVIENACRYAQRQVRVSMTREKGSVLYSVEDDGPGVGEEERHRIFEPGHRGKAGQQRNGVNGAGLGLALARRLARSASGEVEALPDGSGGRFLVRLPSG